MDDRETIVVCSGGGSRGFWQWLILLMIAQKYKIAMICGTSAGALNAYGFAKGEKAQQYVTKTYHEVFATNAAPITSPGLGEIKNGKLSFNMEHVKRYLLDGINFWDIFKLPFKKQQAKILDRIIKNFISAPALLSNAPLFDRVKELQDINPGFEIPAFWSKVDMQNGPLIECAWNDKVTLEQERHSVVASSTIPLLWPLVDGRYGDGGLREGIPLDMAFKRLDPRKRYRIIMIECNQDEMTEGASLANPLHIAAQMIAIQMNESRRNDKKAILDKNQEAMEKGEASGRLYIPISSIRCSSTKSSLDFSPEAKADFASKAQQDFATFISRSDAV